MSQTASLPEEKPLSASHTNDWTDVGYHPFMFDVNGPDPIDVVLDLRSGIGRLPETASLFTLDRVLDQHHKRHVKPEHVALCGSWHVHGDLVGESNSRKFVNPASDDKYQYADVTVRCRCGTAFSHTLTATANTPGSQDHRDDCKPHWHYDALSELWRRREEVAKTSLLLGTWTGRDVANRIGIKEPQIQRFAKKCNLSVGEYRNTGRELMVRTVVKLLERHSMAKVASAYNYSKSRLRKQIRDCEVVDVDLTEIAEERKEMDTRSEWVPYRGDF